jgi:hypothetical protein
MLLEAGNGGRQWRRQQSSSRLKVEARRRKNFEYFRGAVTLPHSARIVDLEPFRSSAILGHSIPFWTGFGTAKHLTVTYGVPNLDTYLILPYTCMEQLYLA